MSQSESPKSATTLVVSQLAVERGGRLVIRDLDFRVSGGTALIVTGPNGAGKTTLIRTIAGYLPRLHGSIELIGGHSDAGLHEQLHYIGHQNAIKPAMTVRENISFWAGYLGGSQVVDQALEQFRLRALADVPAAYLSAGQKRRTALARLVAAERPVWLLDEPTVALDAASRDGVIAAGDAHLAKGGIIIAATHIPLPFAVSEELALRDIGMAA